MQGAIPSVQPKFCSVLYSCSLPGNDSWRLLVFVTPWYWGGGDRGQSCSMLAFPGLLPLIWDSHECTGVTLPVLLPADTEHGMSPRHWVRIGVFLHHLLPLPHIRNVTLAIPVKPSSFLEFLCALCETQPGQMSLVCWTHLNCPV